MYGGWCRFKYNFGKIHTYIIIFLSIYTKLYAYIFLSQYRDRCLKLKHQTCLLELFKFQPDTFPLIPSHSIKLFPDYTLHYDWYQFIHNFITCGHFRNLSVAWYAVPVQRTMWSLTEKLMKTIAVGCRWS